jgi:hypothetical protein
MVFRKHIARYISILTILVLMLVVLDEEDDNDESYTKSAAPDK